MSSGSRRSPLVRHRRLLAGTAVSLASIGVTYAFVLPRLAGYSAVWRIVTQLSTPWSLGLAAVVVANAATFAFPWMVVLPNLRFLDALAMTQASTAVSLVVPGGAPVGMAVSFAMLRSGGLSPTSVSLAVTLTGVWNQLSTFLFPVFAVALLAAEGTGSNSLALVTLVGASFFVAITLVAAAALWQERIAVELGDRLGRAASSLKRRIGREPVRWNGTSFARFRTTGTLLLRQSWHLLTVTTILNQLTGYALLELAVRALGIPRAEISLTETFAAWSVGRLLSSLPLTPGGVGVVELGLVGTLVGFGGNHVQVVAAVILYRFLSVVPTLGFGLVGGVAWRRASRSSGKRSESPDPRAAP